MFGDKWNDHIRLLPHDRVFRRLIEPLIPSWLLPNHLTVLRIFLIPLVLYFLHIKSYDIGVPLFMFAALTDSFDGSLARVRKQITEWGIKYDPLADKLLIGSVLFVIVLQHINYYLGIALLVTEAVMIIGAWWRQRRGKVEPANFWGKLKMVTEVVGISLLLLALWFDISLLVEVSAGTLALALAVAIVSILSRLHT
ncbi:MAG: CDP-alcohol phosphatidyltransferase family protein [Patescibacteria group bacterium]